ncbi:hypothetical protein CP533_0101 [Ophiocordyceps camponoti-saundersi (nom. inval.)]|nr:hypothetical protein CP533_0101 [Ophiocordyceps camponoti-saundersi (nom. inval.)]
MKKNESNNTIRPATMADLSTMTSLICTSLAEEPAWRRLCPPASEVESLLAEAISNKRKEVMVLEDETNTIVSASVWEEEQQQSSIAVVPSHAAATTTGKGSHSRCASDVVDDEDEDKTCLALRLLATRPDCQRRGYGRALASWGVRRAGKRSVPVCVLAAERGYILFSGMGFVDCGSCLCQDNGSTAIAKP